MSGETQLSVDCWGPNEVEAQLSVGAQISNEAQMSTEAKPLFSISNGGIQFW